MTIVVIERASPLFYIGLAHRGHYSRIGPVFHALEAALDKGGLWNSTGEWAAILHDDPALVPTEELRAHACCAFPADQTVPEGFDRVEIPAGRYATLLHVGPLADLPRPWQVFTGTALSEAGLSRRLGVASERYLDDPDQTPPERTRTELAVPV
jgi:AraC family transcriptional regulator